MDFAWLELAGRFSLFCYLGGIGGLLTVLVLRAAWGSPRLEASSLAAGVSRAFFDYVGNLGSPHDDDSGPEWASLDRRTDRRSRVLLDWLKSQMRERGFHSANEEEFLEHLREAIRQEEVTSSARSWVGGEE